MNEFNFEFEMSKTIRLGLEYESKILEICNNVLPNTNYGSPCKYIMDYKDIVCVYDLHNNFGSRGSGIYWMEFCLRHLRYALNLDNNELLNLLDCIYKYENIESSSQHPVDYLYVIYQKNKRVCKINSVLE